MKGLADEVRRLGKDRFEIDRAGQQEHRENSERKAEIADPVDQKRLDRRGIRLRLVEPEADQQIARQPNAFPAEEQLREIVGRHQHQHGEGEERQIREEARPVRIVGHVADRIEMHEGGYRRHHDQHHGGERIDAQRPIDFQIADGDEVEDRDMGVMPGKADIVEGVAGQHPGDGKERRGDQLGRLRAGGGLDALMLLGGCVGEFGVRGVRRRRGVHVLRHERRGMIVMRRRRILARQAVAGADERDGAGNDGAKKRQEDDRFVHCRYFPRHARARRGHPRLCDVSEKASAWMAGT